MVSLAPPQSAHAAFPGRNGRLAFNWQFDCNASVLASIRPDASGLRWLRPTVCDSSPEPVSRTRPTWSPDGRYLYFAEGVQAARVRPSGSGFRVLPNAPGIPATWAPDGRHFAYTQGPADGRFTLWTATIDGTDNRRLGYGLYPSWSPDGRYIAYMTDPASGLSDGKLWIRDAETGKPIRRLSRTCGQSDWSPDSRRLVCAASFHGGAVFVIDPHAAHPPRRIVAPARTIDPVWSPDGRRIAFLRTRELNDSNEQTSIWTVDSSGRNPRRIFTTQPTPSELIFDATDLAWQPRPTAP